MNESFGLHSIIANPQERCDMPELDILPEHASRFEPAAADDTLFVTTAFPDRQRIVVKAITVISNREDITYLATADYSCMRRSEIFDDLKKTKDE